MEHPHLKRAIELCDLVNKAIKERYSWETIDGLLTKMLVEMKEGLKQIERSKPGRRPNSKQKPKKADDEDEPEFKSYNSVSQ